MLHLLGNARAAAAARLMTVLLIAALLSPLAGCRHGWLSPHEVGRFRADPLLLPILTQLDIGVDEPDEMFIEADDVRPEDLEVIREDYVIEPNDLVSVEIRDLMGFAAGQVVTKRISERGNVSLPMVGEVQAVGLTEAQLEAAIVDRYREMGFIEDAQVSVTVLEARGRTYRVLGAVGAPGQYAILNADYRILDALVDARDVTAIGIDFLYVVRRVRPEIELPPGVPLPVPPDDLLEPRPRSQAPGSLQPLSLQVVPDVAPRDEQQPMQPEPEEEMPFEFNDLEPERDTRIIRIPLPELRQGELQYNIVVRPRDLIIVPQPVIGEYYVAGHVLRPGVYSLTARRMTLKQAVMSAGMFGGMAVPQRTDVIRRIGRDQEVIVRVDMARIFEGRQSDVFLRPNDQILVGTNVYAPFIAAARGAFRMTYGFGFLYDRNFAVQRDRQFR